jgi:hypothetical protein
MIYANTWDGWWNDIGGDNTYGTTYQIGTNGYNFVLDKLPEEANGDTDSFRRFTYHVRQQGSVAATSGLFWCGGHAYRYTTNSMWQMNSVSKVTGQDTTEPTDWYSAGCCCNNLLTVQKTVAAGGGLFLHNAWTLEELYAGTYSFGSCTSEQCNCGRACTVGGIWDTDTYKRLKAVDAATDYVYCGSGIYSCCGDISYWTNRNVGDRTYYPISKILQGEVTFPFGHNAATLGVSVGCCANKVYQRVGYGGTLPAGVQNNRYIWVWDKIFGLMAFDCFTFQRADNILSA